MSAPNPVVEWLLGVGFLLVEFSLLLVPAALGAAVVLCIASWFPPATRTLRARRILVAYVSGLASAVAAYAWLFRFASGGWFVYAVPAIVLMSGGVAIAFPRYLRMKPPERVGFDSWAAHEDGALD